MYNAIVLLGHSFGIRDVALNVHNFLNIENSIIMQNLWEGTAHGRVVNALYICI